jgi:tRNA A-37 threonylcarbamoyl transferase component Bud32
VLKQALGKLRVAVDWYSPPERIGREARAIEILGGLLPAGTVPSLVFFDAEQHLLAMSAVPEPHSNWKNELLAGKVEPAHVEQFARILAAIHWGGFEMRERLPAVFADRSVFESLRLEPYYEYTAERAPGAAPFLHALAAETRGIGLTLVHGDYSPKNVLIHRGRMVLLDHEVMHLGDPAFDLGFSLTHLLSKARHLPDSRERLRRAAHLYWRTYCEAIPDAGWAPAIENRVVRHTLGCLMARVAGRSPLEYLTEAERRGQFSAASELSAAPPATVPETIEEFVGRTP